MAAARVDAVVISWNNWELTADCVASLIACGPNVNVIVVDNGSSDGAPEHLRVRFPGLRVEEFGENLGYGAAANRGAAFGDAEFISIVNNDTELAHDYFDHVLARCDAEARVGFASGLSINPATNLVDAGGATIDHALNWYPYLRGAHPDDVEVDETLVVSPASDAIIYRREAFDALDGFDPEIFAYAEDLDLSLRLAAAGWRPAIVPAARVVHRGSATLGSRSVAQMRLASWGRGYVAGRYRVAPQWLLLDLAVAMVNSVLLRSTVPVTRLVAGWRRGRALSRRPVPEDLQFEHWREALKKRYRTVAMGSSCHAAVAAERSRRSAGA